MQGTMKFNAIQGVLANQRIGSEQTERPLGHEHRKPIVSAPERNQRTDAAHIRTMLLSEATNECTGTTDARARACAAP